MKIKLSDKFKLEKGFKQFLVKTVVFIGIFALIQIVTIKITAQTRLPASLNPFYLVDIAKSFFFVLILFFLVYRQRLFKLEKNKFELKSLLIFGPIAILLTLGYFWLKEIILANLNFALSYSILFALLLYFILFLMMFSLILAIYGYKFCKFFYKQFKKEIWIFIGFFILIFFLSNEVQKAWFMFSKIVTKIVYLLLSLSASPTININGKIPIIGLNNLIVGIDKPCSGIESIFLFSVLYIFAVCFDWKILNKKKAILLFILGVISVFLLNVLRVYSMILIGAYLSKDFALGLFHTNIGWIIFLTYFAIFWLLFYNWMKKKEFKSENKGFIKRFYARVISDSLYKNSIYLIVSTFMISFLGFFFWMINTRLFTAEQIGLATTIISISILIITFSSLGLGQGLIRYLPKSKVKNKKINTCFTLVALVTIIITTIFLLTLKEISPKILFIKENVILSFIFIIFMIFYSLSSLIDNVFVAFRSAKYIVLKNSIFGVLKLVFPFLLVSLGAYGIFGSYMLPMIVGFIISFIILVYKFNYRPKFVFYDDIIRKIGRYSFGNYVAGFIGSMPTLLLPLIITNRLHPEVAAYYYMAMMIGNILFIIPSATSNSLFAEGSNNEKDINNHVKKSIKLIALFMIPAIIITILFGKYMLLLLGKSYSEQGYQFLNLIAVSGIFIGINNISGALFRVKNMVKESVLISFLSTILLLGLSFLMLDKGLLGIGYAWIIGNAITNIIYFSLLAIKWREKKP